MPDKKTSKVGIALLSVFLLILASCDGGDSIRSYEEETPQAQSKTVEHVPNNQLKWDTPEGWVQEANKSSMRLATFTVGANDSETICTIVPLKGEAGGLKANVLRWLGQLKIQLQSEKELNDFLEQKIQFTTKGEFPGVLVDFTSLTQKADDTSMLVGIVKVSDTSLFVKMSGARDILAANRPALETLCKSIHIGTNQ
jgi:hypothetical protein